MDNHKETAFDLSDEGSRWSDVEILQLLSDGANAIGAGTPTELGRSWINQSSHSAPITLGGGIPDTDLLPTKDLQAALVEVLGQNPKGALEYGGVLGFDGLRSVLADRQSLLEGITVGPDSILMNNGSAGCIDTICRTFINPGDCVIVESPSFSGSLRTIQGHQARIHEIPVLSDELAIQTLESVLQNMSSDGMNPKFLYTIPDFHNPTGATMSTEQRMRLIDLCLKYKVLIVEDAAYSEIYFNADGFQSIYSLARGIGVLKVGTFSKSIATGLRVGWIQASPDLIAFLSKMRFDMGTSPLLLRALHHYVSTGKLEAHLANMRPLYAKKCEVLCQTIAEHGAPTLSFVQPQGGFFLWVSCNGVSSNALAESAAQEGLLFPTGNNFFVLNNDGPPSHIRLAFSNATLEELSSVGPRIGRALRQASTIP